MRMLVAVLCLTGVVACGESASGPTPGPPVAVTLHPLSMTPGCFSPYVYSAHDAVQQETLSVYFANIESNLTPWSNLADAVLANPTDEEWQANYAVPGRQCTITLTASVLDRQDGFGFLSVTDQIQGDCDSSGQIKDVTTVDHVTYSARSTILETEVGLVARWNDHALSVIGFGMDLLRGCDPATNTRFELFFAPWPQPLHCWDAVGTDVPCGGVDSWPE